MQLTVSGTPSGEVDLEVTIDGVNWLQVASAILASQFKSADGEVSAVIGARANLVSISGGGSVTVAIAAS